MGISNRLFQRTVLSIAIFGSGNNAAQKVVRSGKLCFFLTLFADIICFCHEDAFGGIVSDRRIKKLVYLHGSKGFTVVFIISSRYYITRGKIKSIGMGYTFVLFTSVIIGLSLYEGICQIMRVFSANVFCHLVECIVATVAACYGIFRVFGKLIVIDTYARYRNAVYFIIIGKRYVLMPL